MTHDGPRTTDGRPTTDDGALTWRKSSFSGPQGGECVEVATTPGSILVRDSKDPHAARLAFAPGAWAGFLAGIRAGEFDLT